MILKGRAMPHKLESDEDLGIQSAFCAGRVGKSWRVVPFPLAPAAGAVPVPVN